MTSSRGITVVASDGRPVGTAAIDAARGLVVLQLPGVGEIPFTTAFLETVLAGRLAGTVTPMHPPRAHELGQAIEKIGEVRDWLHRAQAYDVPSPDRVRKLIDRCDEAVNLIDEAMPQ